MPDRLSEYMSDIMLETMSDRMPERMSDRVPQRRCQTMLGKMSGYMPKHTSWHVMAGITHSKVSDFLLRCKNETWEICKSWSLPKYWFLKNPFLVRNLHGKLPASPRSLLARMPCFSKTSFSKFSPLVERPPFTTGFGPVGNRARPGFSKRSFFALFGSRKLQKNFVEKSAQARVSPAIGFSTIYFW